MTEMKELKGVNVKTKKIYAGSISESTTKGTETQQQITCVFGCRERDQVENMKAKLLK